ncbi:hypothetical protein O9929_02585 [Vibrio lentus]|nr:hypothetical protein [Vibrio lentus]
MNETGSDSSSLDNMLDLFPCRYGCVFRAMRMLVPLRLGKTTQTWIQSFVPLRFQPAMEPWDGPAGIVPSDGRYVACNLDTETDYALLVM